MFALFLVTFIVWNFTYIFGAWCVHRLCCVGCAVLAVLVVLSSRGQYCSDNLEMCCHVVSKLDTFASRPWVVTTKLFPARALVSSITCLIIFPPTWSAASISLLLAPNSIIPSLQFTTRRFCSTNIYIYINYVYIYISFLSIHILSQFVFPRRYFSR